MNKKLEKNLVEKYPNLYKKYGGNIKETSMGWGMTCGNGWYNLIDELSQKLESLEVVAAQVKQKLGGLRFYIEKPESDQNLETIQKIILEAESKSFEICEICGEPGELRGGALLQTLCDTCQDLYIQGKIPPRFSEEFGAIVNERT